MGATQLKQSERVKEIGLHQFPGQVLVDDDISGGRWFECAPEWPSPGTGGIRASAEQWRKTAEQALESASRMYDKRAAQRGRKDIQKVLNREKTVVDKIAACTLVVQESPLHRLDELQTLFSFVKKKGRRERSPAIDAFKDLLINDLLPADRRLMNFDDRDFNCGAQQLTKRHLGYALFEEELKHLYSEFLEVLEECGRDSVSHFKLKSVSVVFDLLVAKPENEKQMLSILVNKLGDPERKVASNASYYLRLLVEKHHPQMKLILIREVELLLHRKNVGRKTQYYAVSFLNQLKFGKDDVELSRRLVSLYMDVVTLCVKGDSENKPKKEGGVDSKESRIMGALLTGVNRAFPFTQPESFDPSLEDHYDSLFRIGHAKSVVSAVQALSFLLQLSQCNATVSDRFYRALYSRIGDLASAGESKVPLFLNLIYKSMKADVSGKRVKAFTKRLLQTALHSSAALSAGILVLLSEVLAEKHPGMLKASTTVPECDDDDEVFRDVDSDEENIQASGSNAKIENPAEQAAQDEENGNLHSVQDRYNISAREPLYARAERSALWELVALAAHNHPSVSRFSAELCKAQDKIVYPSDPLNDFTLLAFLDKFSFKKPKKKLSASLHGKRAVRVSESLVLNSNKFFDSMRKGEEAEEDAFFGRFFQINPTKLDTIEGKQVEDDQPKLDGLDSESEEEAFEKAMHEEMRRLGGGIPLAVGGDIDDDDPDELAAFDVAFKNEIGNSSNDDADETALVTEPVLMLDMKENEDGDETTGKGGMQNFGSVFAAAEDYAEAIESADVEQDFSDLQSEAKAHKKMRKRKEASPSVQRASKKSRTSRLSKIK